MRDAPGLDRGLLLDGARFRGGGGGGGGRSVVVLAKELNLGRDIGAVERPQDASHERVDRRGQDEVQHDRRQRGPRSIGPAGARSPSTKCTISNPNE